jgi:hypothetical protein
MTSKLKTDVLETVSGSGTIALTNQLSGMTTASVPLLDYTKMPAGSVLQMVRTSTNFSPTITTTSTSLVPTGITATITPLYANSIILVSYVGAMSWTNGIMNAKIYVKIGSASYAVMSGAGAYMLAYRDTGSLYTPICADVQHQATSTDTLIFQPYFLTSSGTTSEFSHSNAATGLTLTEIKQ